MTADAVERAARGRDAARAATGAPVPPPLARHWEDLVTVALLGTDRRDPPAPPDVLADVVDDTARAAPSQRMLAQVAACTAVRRAAFRPAPALPPLQPPEPDPRPVCPPAAVERWSHVSSTWPVLEDEWTIELVRLGWRLAPELVPPMLGRHRRDPARRARVLVAAGPLGAWLIDLLPALEPARRARASDAGALDVLPELPIPAELLGLLDAPPEDVAAELGEGLDTGRFGPAHRGVLVNLLARVPRTALPAVTARLERVDQRSPGQVLADLARTRHRMLAELDGGDPP